MYRACVVIEFSVDMDSVVLASFIALARGIKFYDANTRSSRCSLKEAQPLRHQCSRSACAVKEIQAWHCLFGSSG